MNKIMSLKDFQMTFLNRKKSDNFVKKNIVCCFNIHDNHFLININNIHFIFENEPFETISFSKKYFIGYQYFNNQFYSLLDFKKYRFDEYTNLDLKTWTIYLKDDDFENHLSNLSLIVDNLKIIEGQSLLFKEKRDEGVFYELDGLVYCEINLKELNKNIG